MLDGGALFSSSDPTLHPFIALLLPTRTTHQALIYLKKNLKIHQSTNQTKQRERTPSHPKIFFKLSDWTSKCTKVTNKLYDAWIHRQLFRIYILPLLSFSLTLWCLLPLCVCVCTACKPCLYICAISCVLACAFMSSRFHVDIHEHTNV